MSYEECQVQSPWTLEQMRAEAEIYRYANPPEVDPFKLIWSFDPCYPRGKFVSLMNQLSWEQWFQTEAEIVDKELDRPGYMTRLRDHLAASGDVYPIIAIEDPTGRLEGIWDGWHRSACFMVGSGQGIPAIVGRRVAP